MRATPTARFTCLTDVWSKRAWRSPSDERLSWPARRHSGDRGRVVVLCALGGRAKRNGALAHIRSAKTRGDRADRTPPPDRAKWNRNRRAQMAAADLARLRRAVIRGQWPGVSDRALTSESFFAQRAMLVLGAESSLSNH